MRAKSLGCFYSVRCTPDDVAMFASPWPCNGFPANRGITFEFDSRNGDLVDMHPSNWEERRADGGAILALSQDAQEFGRAQLHLNT